MAFNSAALNGLIQKLKGVGESLPLKRLLSRTAPAPQNRSAAARNWLAPLVLLLLVLSTMKAQELLSFCLTSTRIFTSWR